MPGHGMTGGLIKTRFFAFWCVVALPLKIISQEQQAEFVLQNGHLPFVHSNAEADRLLFYFGGHGGMTIDEKTPFLVTYDYNPKMQTSTSFLMRDLTTRQAENIATHQVIMLLDACHAGLVKADLGNDMDFDEKKNKKFRELSIIRAETEPRARNLILAGTGEQRALWENGGVFTQVLIDGLMGGADLNGDGLIQFEELGIFVKNGVVEKTSTFGVRQEPVAFPLDRYGTGRVLFEVP
jgi:uncharacterized caspase-like protein